MSRKTELQNEIRRLTKIAKERYNTKIKSNEKLTGAVKTELESLRNVGILNSRNQIVMKLRGKSEEQLTRQLHELEYFNQWQGMETRAVRDKANYSKYQSFKNYTIAGTDEKPFENFTYQEWRNMVEFMGTQSSLIESFGFDSQTVIDLANEMKEKNIDLTDDKLIGLMQKARKEATSQTDAVDMLRELIGLNR